MRSRSGPGMVSSMFAVQMNITPRQIERHRQIVVAEGRVLLRIEHLEQRRRRVAVEAAGAELVDLVEHHHAVARPDLAQVLDDVARQRADVGAAMAADLRLVVHAAQAHAHELAPGRPRDALAERGLAHAGRADEAQDRALARGIELAHREKLEDAPLDLLQPVMVLVEDAPRLGDVDRRRAARRPRAARSASRDRCGSSSIRPRLRACARGACSSLRACFSTSSGICAAAIALLELGDLGRALVAFAELLLDRAHLLAQQVLAIGCRRSIRACARRSRATPCSTSMRCDSSSSSLSSRVLRSKVSSSACFSSALMSISPAMKSASRAGPSTACSAATISSGTCGRSCRISTARSFRLCARPSMSASSGLRGRR